MTEILTLNQLHQRLSSLECVQPDNKPKFHCFTDANLMSENVLCRPQRITFPLFILIQIFEVNLACFFTQVHNFKTYIFLILPCTVSAL